VDKPNGNPTPLYVHTLETLCKELISGRAVGLAKDGVEFRIDSSAARSILEWYRVNTTKWNKNVQKGDLEAITDRIQVSPPECPPLQSGKTARQTRVIHLGSIRVHRFASIHHYGDAVSAPQEFDFTFEKPLTLIHGRNGSGKTSIMSAISWCLTGHVFRSQRAPERTDNPVELGLAGTESEEESPAGFDISAVTPIPPAVVIEALGDQTVPLDTWVELRFVDDIGSEVGTIRRSVSRSSRGSIVESEPDFSSLDLDPMAREVGTRLPGLVPYVQLGEFSDLGRAVTELTGFRPLQDLVKHVTRVQNRLRRGAIDERRAEIATVDEEFLVARKELTELVDRNPEIAPTTSVPSPQDEGDLESLLQELTDHFDGMAAESLEESRLILGDSFEPADRSLRKDLIESVGPALGSLALSSLARLPSAARLGELGRHESAEAQSAERLILELLEEAQELALLQEEPERASRLRLYSRIVGWLTELPEPPHEVASCPVCSTALEGKSDSITQRPITEHFEQLLRDRREYLEKTISSWQDAALARLRSELPMAVRAELERDLPNSPSDLIENALVQELFDSEHFGGALKVLRSYLINAVAGYTGTQGVQSLESFQRAFRIA
jgi:hypothetical protein